MKMTCDWCKVDIKPPDVDWAWDLGNDDRYVSCNGCQVIFALIGITRIPHPSWPSNWIELIVDE
jgi:hypothetical protein